MEGGLCKPTIEMWQGGTFLPYPATIAWGDSAEMQKAVAMLDEVKESIINAYEIKTGLDRKKLSKLMDAETWMDANSAVEYGFADEIMQRNTAEDMEIPKVGMTYSHAAVTNSLMDKLSKKCRIQKQEPKTTADSLMERLDLIKNWR